jgi:hypothetical protein
MALTAEQIIAANDLGMVKVTVKEWGGDVYLRVMTVGERDSWEREWIGKRETGIENFRAKYLARCLCDEAGNRLFTDDQIDLLAKKSARTISPLFDKALEVNSMSDKDVEELAKN